MNFGKMRQKITLVKPSQSQDSYGEPLAPTTIATVFAQIQMLSQKYMEKTQIVITESTHKFTIRWMPGLTSDMQIQYDGRVFNIEAIFDPTELKRVLIIFCYERDGR